MYGHGYHAEGRVSKSHTLVGVLHVLERRTPDNPEHESNTATRSVPYLDGIAIGCRPVLGARDQAVIHRLIRAHQQKQKRQNLNGQASDAQAKQCSMLSRLTCRLAGSGPIARRGVWSVLGKCFVTGRQSFLVIMVRRRFALYTMLEDISISRQIVFEK